MINSKAYEDRTDLEKIQSQWNKLGGLHLRQESSAAIVRAATAAELAANFAIRQEFSQKSEFKSEFIDSVLMWANGISGKIDRLLIPLTLDEAHQKIIQRLGTLAKEINKKRNSVAHQGEFCNQAEAQLIIDKSKEFIETLVKIYEPKFELKDKDI
ncbi:MAG: hypothetical protein Q7T66_02715 [Herminiimonas sp.]|uniref:hypothetical protein n=1 Tax=Herminiimonas sp. TaxID=1926289 RepID=UPI002725DBFB|nr:hypothetical protein [Herminiimonas sp.]MDO9419554.1 hypothetical protein [Herminiimonas sp.]